MKNKSTLSRKKDNDLNLIKAGRGQGIGKDYQPWLLAHQERGDCTSLRCYSRLTGRVHHLFTRKDINYFYELNYDNTITDIREYYALLPRDLTIKLAEKAGIPFPRYSETKDYKILYFDFVVSRGDKITAISVLSGDVLNDISEKRIFDIQSEYCKYMGWNFETIYKEDINPVRINNIRRIMSIGGFDENGFTDEMQACFLNAYFNTDMCAGRIAEMVEERFALPLGAGKELFYYLLRSRYIILSLDVPLIFSTKGEF